jgi:hypothetical protein
MHMTGQLHVPDAAPPPRGKRRRYPLNRSLDGPQSWSGRLEATSCPCPIPQTLYQLAHWPVSFAFVQQDAEAAIWNNAYLVGHRHHVRKWHLRSSVVFLSGLRAFVILFSKHNRWSRVRVCLIESSHIIHTLSTPSVQSSTVITRLIVSFPFMLKRHNTAINERLLQINKLGEARIT